MRVSGFTSSAKTHLYQKQISDVMSSLSYELLNVNDMLSQLKRKLLHFIIHGQILQMVTH